MLTWYTERQVRRYNVDVKLSQTAKLQPCYLPTYLDTQKY